MRLLFNIVLQCILASVNNVTARSAFAWGVLALWNVWPYAQQQPFGPVVTLIDP